MSECPKKNSNMLFENVREEKNENKGVQVLLKLAYESVWATVNGRSYIYYPGNFLEFTLVEGRWTRPFRIGADGLLRHHQQAERGLPSGSK